MNAIIHFMSFQAPMIISGRIPHAIRPKRRDFRNPEPGDLLYLYAGRNTPSRRLLATEMCEYVIEITILPPMGTASQVMLGGEMLDADRINSLARANGFHDDESMIHFHSVTYGLPFQGNLIGWTVRPPHLH